MTVSDPNSFDIVITVSAAEMEKLNQQANAKKQTVQALVKEKVLRDVRPSESVIQTVEEKKK